MIHEPNKEFERLTNSRCCRFGAFACTALQVVGYTLLVTLSELLFTRFFIFVLLCTCLLVSRECFFVFHLLLFFKEKQRSFFFSVVLVF